MLEKRNLFCHRVQNFQKSQKKSVLSLVFYKKNGEKVDCRSSYEVIYANWLMDNRIDFEYEPKTFILSNKRRYTPDFHLIKEDIYTEIKGLDHGNQKENRKVFINDGHKVELLKWPDLVKKCGYPFISPGSHTNRAKNLGIKTEDYLAQRQYKEVKPYKASKKSNTSLSEGENVTLDILNCP